MNWAARRPSWPRAGTAAGVVDALTAAGAEKDLRRRVRRDHRHPDQPKVDVLSSIAEQASPAAIIVASSTDGKEIAGRLAVRLGSGVLADVIAVKEGGVGVPRSSVVRSPSRRRPRVSSRVLAAPRCRRGRRAGRCR